MEVIERNITASSKIWIYQSDKDLSEIRVAFENHLRGFVQNWMSHGDALNANAWIEFNRFIIITIDENKAEASGCSIDGSVHFLKKMESQYDINLFDKMTFAYLVDGQLKIDYSTEFGKEYSQGNINDDTIVFDNLVKTYGDFVTSWKKPLKDSWHKRFV